MKLVTIDSVGQAQSTQNWQGARLCQIYPTPQVETEADVDIIAVHGLDTNSPDTWVWRANRSSEHDINWLADMLPEKSGRARIFYCNWPADLLQKSDSIPMSLEDSARYLLGGLRQHLAANRQAGQERPILFIASCLGGIILIKALDIDNSYDCDEYDIPPLRKATRGIIFLATPFRGTAFNNMPYIILKAWALLQDQTVTALVKYTKEVTSNIDGLVDKFMHLRAAEKYHVFIFWEGRNTSLLRKFYLAWMFSGWMFPVWLIALALAWLLNLFSPCLVIFGFWLLGFSSYQPKQLVNENSARLPGVAGQRLERVHVLMNKFSGPTCKDWEQVAGKIEEIVTKLRQGTPLQQADAWIRDKLYTTERLKIERLSGDPLAMDQCYINLAVIEEPGKVANHPETILEERHTASQSSPFSLFARLNIETPDKAIQVNIPILFNPRKASTNHTIQPRRIMIRGNAGIGKTTLCKKIVYDFNHGIWSELFDRVLWVPLRRLQEWSPVLYNLEHLFLNEYFAHHESREILARELVHIVESPNGGRTLFILDGLDEISQALSRDDHKSDFIRRLLNQPNIIITSRPHISLPAGVRSPDLELETVGFYPNEVKEYIQNTFNDHKTVEAIQIFLQRNQLIQGLVRIPIQLDALCYTWDSLGGKTMPQTMTSLYKSIEENLWKKDILRLRKEHEGSPISWSDIAYEGRDIVESFVSGEIYHLEGLAFTGLCNGVIDFTAERRNAISKRFTLPGTNILLNRNLPCLSFLRASDPLSNDGNPCYHFLHLTFQEYFAARYFVRQWKAQQRLMCLTFKNGKGIETEPWSFLQRNKYNAAYDIFWRFVAGLLDNKEAEIPSFFQAIQGELCDLLGPTHQRLVMHCLSEVVLQNEMSSFTPFRTNLEEQVLQWLLFECKYRGSSLLARERELPQRVLGKAFKQLSDDSGATLLEALYRQPEIPPSNLELAASWLRENISEHKCLLVLGMLKYRQETMSSKVLQGMAARLEDKNWRVRQAAVEALGGRPELPTDTQQVVAVRLKDTHPLVQEAAVEVLGGRPDLPNEILQDVAIQLNDKDIDIRQTAAKALGNRRNLPLNILQAITAQLKDQDNNIRQTAVEILRNRLELPCNVLQAIAALLQDKKWFIRLAAVESLRGQLVLPSSIQQIVAVQLKHRNPFVREAAVEVLGGQLDLPHKILRNVAARLNDPDNNIRQTAVEILGGRPELSNEILQIIVTRLKDRNLFVRETAVEVLGGRLKLPSKALQAVVARLEDQDRFVQHAAVEALRTRSELPSEVLYNIFRRFKNKQWVVRQSAVKVLGSRPELPSDILQAVVALLKDPDNNVRLTAVEMLGNRLELPSDILQAIATQLNDPDNNVRLTAVEVLGGRLELPSDILQAVVALLKDLDNDVRLIAVETLGGRLELSIDILQAIATRLKDPDKDIRQTAVEALDRPELPSDILGAIVTRLKDKDKNVRRTAVNWFRGRSELPFEVLQAMAARFEDSEEVVQEAAVRVLTSQSSVPSEIVNRCIQSVYPILLRICFEEHLAWYIADDISYIVAAHREIPLKGQQARLSDAIQEVRKELKIPLPNCGRPTQSHHSIDKGETTGVRLLSAMVVH